MSDMTPRMDLDAVLQSFWQTRAAQQIKQKASGKQDQGNRGAATGGSHLDALGTWIRATCENAGVNPAFILSGRKLTLPGFFRPAKDWDIILYNGTELGAAIELKSHIGPSFGNNFNNRVEEAIGNAMDVRVAFRENLLGDEQPWLGYLMVLQTVSTSTKPTKTTVRAFAVDEELDGASYKSRYEHMCRRVMREQLYDAACLIPTGSIVADEVNMAVPSDVAFEQFAAKLVARAQYLAMRPGWA